MATEAFVLKGSALLLSIRALKSFFMLVSAIVMLLFLPFRGRRRVSPVEKEDKNQNHDCCHHHRKGAVVRVPAKIVPWKSGAGVVAVKVFDYLMRREMAIKRLLEDGDEKCMREYWLFRTKRGDTIFTQCWTPVSVRIRGLVILMHGLNEHSGRYSNYAKKLNANGYKVYGMDWIGHGGSDGLHGYVHSLDDAVSDLKVFIEKVKTENPGLPCFCYGHSTGAAITLKALLDPKVEACIAGATFTSPAVGVEASHPILEILAPILSFLLPRFPCNAAYKKGLPVSRDPEAVIAKYTDPLVCTGSLRIRTGYEILRITGCLQRNLRKLRVPFLVLHGTCDSVTDPTASQKLYEEASSNDKSIKLYEGFSHDLLFEPEKEDITKDLIQWFNSRV
ncbi:unnamed protein product [Lathyrus oleraceus]